MNIVNFTPYPALMGGLLIGLAATILLVGCGRIFGISGIVAGVLNPKKHETLWRVLSLFSLVIGAFLANTFYGGPKIIQTENPITLIIAGLLIGFGSRLGGGCTSGHGVCGISRLSPRSIIATLTFMATGIITVALSNL